jgi:hypothetical protein
VDTHFSRGKPAKPIIGRSASDLAIEHIQLMESRIAQQATLIERAKLLGEDTSDAKRRLKLLCRALDEMRVQLAPLCPTELDAKRPDWAALIAYSRTGKAR